MEDYYECLHHKKEVCPTQRREPPAIYVRSYPLQADANDWACDLQAAKTRALQHAYRKAQAAHPREDAPRAGTIRNLGLLDADEDTNTVLGSK